MKEIIDKLSSYNIFNYLFPGVVFSVLVTKFTNFNLVFDNLFVAAFLFYFIGLTISRIGSVIIEPLLKWLKFVKFAEYQDFVSTSKTDNKLEILSEVNNMYRTIISMCSILFLIIGFEKISRDWDFVNDFQDSIVLTIMLILFLLSYRKQTKYIYKRINKSK